MNYYVILITEGGKRFPPQTIKEKTTMTKQTTLNDLIQVANELKEVLAKLHALTTETDYRAESLMKEVHQVIGRVALK